MCGGATPRTASSERSYRRVAALVAVLAGLHGLAYAPFTSGHLATDSRTYVAAADALSDGGYTTPLRAGFFQTPSGLVDITGRRIPRLAWDAPERQAFRPPGYPLLLAAVGAGDGRASRAAAIVLQAALFAAGAFLLVLNLRRWWGPRIALAAGAVYAADVYSKHYVVYLLSEGLAGPLALAAAYALTRAWQERSAAWWAACGAAAGALVLVRAVFVVAIPLLVVAALLRRADIPRRIGAAAVTLAAAAALVVPWLAWTDAVTGRPVLAAWGEGYNLLLAARGEGLGRPSSEVIVEPAFERELASATRDAPSVRELRHDPKAHPAYEARADERLSTAARKVYAHRLAHEPWQVAWEVVYRAYFLWDAHEDWYQPKGILLLGMRIVDWLSIALAAAGAALALREGGPARATTLFLVVYTAVLAIHHVEARFAMPLRGLFLGLAVYAVVRAGEAVRRRAELVDRLPR